MNEVLYVCVDCLDICCTTALVEVLEEVFVCEDCYEKRCFEGVIGGMVDVYA